jgi:oxalate decarboxylase/phosphoglucose isomerase-like protein (cupin superfamily)
MYNLDDMKTAQEILGRDEAGRPYLSIVYQYSGDIITVPPGWAHAVYNLQVSDCDFMMCIPIINLCVC